MTARGGNADPDLLGSVSNDKRAPRSVVLGFKAQSTPGTGRAGIQAVVLGAFAQVTAPLGGIAIGSGYDATRAPLASGDGAIAIGATSVLNFAGARATAANAIAIGSGDTVNGTGPAATAVDATAIGRLAVASIIQGISIGSCATASTGAQAIAIGSGVNSTSAPVATGQGAIAIGASNGSGFPGARSSALSSIAIGSGDSATVGASATGNYSLSMGIGASASAGQTQAFGAIAQATSTQSIAIGSYSAATTGAEAIALGAGVSATAAPISNAQGAIAIGASDNTAVAGARASAADAIAIGSGDASVAGASASAADAIAVGRTAAAAHARAIALGQGVATTAVDQVNLGIKRIIEGVPTTAPADADLIASQASPWYDETNLVLTYKVKSSGSAVRTFSLLPAITVGRTTNVTIANTETQIVGMTVPANSLKVGSIFRFKCGGLWTNTAASTTSIIRVRFGTTTLIGNIAATTSMACGATARTNIPFMFDAMITVLSTGGSGTVLGFIMPDLGNVIAPILSAPATAAVALDTTAVKIAELTYISGLAGNSITVQSATINQEV